MGLKLAPTNAETGIIGAPTRKRCTHSGRIGESHRFPLICRAEENVEKP